MPKGVIISTERTRPGGGRRAAFRALSPYRLPPRVLSWMACFLVIAAVLVTRNAYLFTTRIYEDGDFAANAIAVLQAKHFQLLTGNYSRIGFYHPGPGLLYVQAWGEWLFHDVMHLVPTPWNGQLLAVLLLNAALMATAIAVFARDGGTAVAIAGLGTVLAFTVLHPLALNSNWMPYVYFAPALLLLVSAAAVASGRTSSVPLLCFAAGLCIHGHVEFLFFAPIVAAVALAGLFIRNRRSPLTLFRAGRWDWLGGGAITLVLALPIALHTVINWPGELPRYLAYGSRASQTLHQTPAAAVAYTLRFWWPGRPAQAVHAPEYAVAAAGGLLVSLLAFWLAARCRHPGQRRFLLWSLAFAVLDTVLFMYYAWRDIDELFTTYEGYFYWSAPLLVLLAGAAGAAGRIQFPRRRFSVPALAALIAAAVAASMVSLRADDPWGPGQYFGDPGMPHYVAALTQASGGRPIVLHVSQPVWPDAVGVIAYADRIGVRACVAEARWTILFRAQSVCTPPELRAGTAFSFISKVRVPQPPGRPLLAMPATLIYLAAPSAATGGGLTRKQPPQPAREGGGLRRVP